MRASPNLPTFSQQVPKTDFGGEVYFVRAEGLGLIKIGYARDALERLRTIGVCCPVEVTLLASMWVKDGKATEAQLHRRFKVDRVRGEWFRETPDLLAAIEEVRTAPVDNTRDLMRRAMLRAALTEAYG